MPRTDIQVLATAAAVFGIIATVMVHVYAIGGYTGAGVGIGLFLAAGYLWLKDPANMLVVI